MLANNPQPANYEQCIDDLINEAQLFKAFFKNLKNDQDTNSFKKTASKQLIS